MPVVWTRSPVVAWFRLHDLAPLQRWTPPIPGPRAAACSALLAPSAAAPAALVVCGADGSVWMQGAGPARGGADALAAWAAGRAGGGVGDRVGQMISKPAQMIAGKVNTVKSIAIDTYGRAGDIASEALDVVKGVRDTALVRGLVGLFHRPAEQPDARDV